MRELVLIIVFAISPLFLYSQEQTNTLKVEEAKTQMVLRSNTRDQVCTLKDNTHRKQKMNRKLVVINRQQLMNKKRMNQFQQQKIRTAQQQNMQKRRIRQQAARQQQSKGMK